MRNKTNILLVEDDQVDAMTILRAFQDLKITNPILHFQNGEEALLYLQNQENEKPCIIILDLNMPRMGGLEFLKMIKANEFLKSIPVIIMTTSKDEQDRLHSFNLGVAGYMIKPTDYSSFVEVLKTIHLYWSLSELPE